MASYPSAVKSFASRSAAQTIASAHINDLQDEVNAIEAGLLNGLAHTLTISTGGLTVSTGSVNLAGPSSLATLQVNGASTFAGPVTLSSAVTVNGAMTFGSSGTVTLPRPSACRVTHSALTQIPGVSNTGLNWDTERFNTGAIHSTSVNSSRITFGSTGLWMVGANIEFSSNVQGDPRVRIYLNDTNPIVAAAGPLVGSKAQILCPSGLWNVTAAADYITCVVDQTSGSTSRILLTADSSPEFWAFKVSA